MFMCPRACYQYGNGHDNTAANAINHPGLWHIASVLRTVGAAVDDKDPKQIPHGEPAPPAKPGPERNQRAALNIVLSQFRTQRRTGYFVKGNGGSYTNTHYQQVPEKHLIGGGSGGVPNQKERQRYGDDGSVDKRVSAAPARLGVIGNIANEWIGDGIEDQHDQDGQTGKVRGKTKDLNVNK